MAKKKTKKDKEKFIEVLRAKDGHIGKACKAAGIGRRTYYDWLEEEWFRAAIREMEEEELDDAEELARMHRKGVPEYLRDAEGKIVRDANGKPILVGWIVKPDPKMIKHYLETKGKDRGYGKQQQIDVNLLSMPESASLGLKVNKRSEKVPVKKKATPEKKPVAKKQPAKKNRKK